MALKRDNIIQNKVTSSREWLIGKCTRPHNVSELLHVFLISEYQAAKYTAIDAPFRKLHFLTKSLHNLCVCFSSLHVGLMA